MFHNDIMYSVMQERARDLRARAKRARDIAAYRRRRKYWVEEAAQTAADQDARQGRRARGAASAAGG